MTSFRSILGSAALLCGLTLSTQAHALSCAPPLVGAPAVESVDVPLNTRIWCGEGWSEDLSPSLRLAGEVVPGTVSVIESNPLNVAVLQPDALLEPSTTYEVECGSDVWTFTTGTEEDLSVPELPSTEVTRNVASVDPDWGNSIYVEFGELDPSTLLIIDVNGEAAIDAREVSGSAQAIIGAPHGWPMLGYSLCDGNFSAKSGESVEVRLGLFNLAGEFSGWSDSKTITFRSLPNDSEPDDDDDDQPVGINPEMNPDPSADPDSDPGADPELDQDANGSETTSTPSGCSWTPANPNSPLGCLAMFGAFGVLSMTRRRRA